MDFSPLKVRELIDQGEFARAEALVRAVPETSESLACLLELQLLTQRETDAVARLHELPAGPVRDELGQQLTDFLYCRSQLAKKLQVPHDPVGEQLAELMGRAGLWTPTPGIGIGISACLIVKNESEYLGRCLESLKGLVDEIVVVDTGSTDNTVEIAESFGAVVGSFEWCSDFAAARNASLKLAKQPWILWIDADEVLGAGCEALLREAVIRPHFGGYMLRIVNFLESSGERTEFVHTPVRLFRNLPTHRFEGKIHEQISPSILAGGGKIASLTSVTIDHYGYLPGVMQDRDKVQRTLTMLQEQLEAEPNDPFHLFNLAMTYSVADDFRASEKAAKQCTEVLPPNSMIGQNAYHLWALALLNQKRYAEACRVADLSESAGYHSILIEYERGQALCASGQLPAALKSALRCVQMEWPDRLTGDLSVATVKRHLLLGRILLESQRFAEALEAIDRATSGPDRTGLRGAALFGMENFAAALTEFESLYAHPEKGLSARLFGARSLFALERFEEAAFICRERSELGAKDEEGFSLWVMAAEKLGDSASVLAAYEAYAQNCTPTAEAFTNWGRAFVEASQWDRALTCFTEAHRLDPTNPNPLLNSGDTLYLAESYLDAAHFYEQALRLDPNHAQAWFVMGNCLMQMGALDGAEAAYAQCLRCEPGHSAAFHNNGLLAEIRAGTLAA